MMLTFNSPIQIINSCNQIPDMSHYHEISFNELLKINLVAEEIKNNAQILLVIGVGGSFLGSRAVIDALSPYFDQSDLGVKVIYAGQNMSGAYLNQLLAYLHNKEVYVNVISKSGSTMEPALAFRLIKKYMEKRYGAFSKNRIIITTDATNGILKQVADIEGYRQFVIPSNIGGRYSVFTPAGLLPIAVTGVDIEEFLNGAKQADTDTNGDTSNHAAQQYAFTRYELYKQGYSVELLASFEPRLSNLHEWWKQLFGESEGKEYKGLYPSTVNYSTDLHAIGQFIQEGSRIMFETLIHFEEVEADMEIPFTIDDIDGLNYLGGRSMNSINAISKDGVALAHEEGGVPVVKIVMPKLDAYHVGYLMFFFMKACVISASLLEVNPFDQPGVEAYKRKMVELLKNEAVLVKE
ncbi:glucose-6-phosphate isomerase [Ureibacillus aquaedulcis]|uniref:Glucose-6-phosphate isomerase n=1 Tax=Ureibacillus aquaedulcis TaxID=3058421 RepID=A0ABT8GLD1_9BACL|nr:glucose-6-phosphate isomerase [Ureibacillus sp. BA0131]MDN4492223.1 glucose-6-phosphate isomerase [Ureibacillus sp. BA0131]